MGPLATVDLFEKIVLHTKADSDSDHIRILIENNPRIPDRTEAILNGGQSPVPFIVASAERLIEAGAALLLIPCITSHYFFDEIQKSCRVPIVNMLEETMTYLENNGVKKAFLFATTGTISTGVYNLYAKKHGVELIVPEGEDQRDVMGLIYDGVKKGDPNFDTARIQKLIDGICLDRDLPVVLGCTELPVAVKTYDLKGTFVDTTLILAKKAIEYAGYEQI